MKKETGIAVISILIGWGLLAAVISKEVLVPSPITVFFIMLSQVKSPAFYQAVMTTLYRMLVGLTSAFISAMILGFLGLYIRAIRELFKPIFAVLKTVPTISYIFLVLLWFGRSSSVTIVSFLVLFPIFYMNIVEGLNSLDPALKNIMRIYPSPLRIQIFKIYLPAIEGYLYAAFKTSLGLGFKVSVMAEILGQIPKGIGRQLQLAKLNFDIPLLFAWTIWIILLSVFTEMIFDWLRNRLKREEEYENSTK